MSGYLTHMWKAGGATASISGMYSTVLFYDQDYGSGTFMAVWAASVGVLSQIIYWYDQNLLPKWFYRKGKKK